MSFVKSPNLPRGQVSTVIMKHVPKLIERLNELGISVLTLPKSLDLAEPVSEHADMSTIHLGGELLIISQSMAGECKALETQGFEVIIAERASGVNYPGDVGLNVLVIGDIAFGNFKYTDPAVITALNGKGIKLVNVAQGYAKCSVCVLDKYSAITADSGMYTALMKNGIETLLISPGYIELNGYAYGFIGGACGKIAADKIAFTGKLNGHPDADRILNFLEYQKIEPVFLSDAACFDIGSIIPVMSDRRFAI